MKTLYYYTDPSYFRGIFNVLDNLAPEAMALTAGALAALTATLTGLGAVRAA
jgi:hypothetical protein